MNALGLFALSGVGSIVWNIIKKESDKKVSEVVDKNLPSPTGVTDPLTLPSKDADTDKKSEKLVAKYSLPSGIKGALRVALVGVIFFSYRNPDVVQSVLANVSVDTRQVIESLGRGAGDLQTEGKKLASFLTVEGDRFLTQGMAIVKEIVPPMLEDAKRFVDKNTPQELKVLSSAQKTAVSGGLGVAFREVYVGVRNIFNKGIGDDKAPKLDNSNQSSTVDSAEQVHDEIKTELSLDEMVASFSVQEKELLLKCCNELESLKGPKNKNARNHFAKDVYKAGDNKMKMMNDELLSVNSQVLLK